MEIAEEYKCKSVAFPLISAGIYGYPKQEAMEVAVETINKYLSEHEDMQVYMVLYGK